MNVLTKCLSLLFVATASLGMSAAPALTVPTPKAEASAMKVISGGKGSVILQPHNRTSRLLRKASTVDLCIPVKSKTPRKAAENVPVINGLNLWDDAWQEMDYPPIGVYTVPTAEGGQFEQLFEASGINYGACATPGFYAGFNYMSFWGYGWATYYTYDLVTGEQLSEVALDVPTDAAIDLTYDATTQSVYGLSYNEEGSAYVLAKYDMTKTGCSRTVVGVLTGEWNSIAADKDGQLFAIDQVGDLYKLDKSTAAMTKVGATGFVPHDLSSAVVDQKTGRMFWTISTEDRMGAICEVDMTTGVAELLYQFPGGNEVLGLYIPAPLASEKAPAAATGLEALFENGLLSGIISFAVPATLFDGTAGSGEVTYRIIADDEYVAAEGVAGYGSEVSVPYTAGSAGWHEFTVTLINDEGESPKSKVKVFIGKGIPKAPAVATAIYDGAKGETTVAWDAVTESADGGFINPDEVTYKVVRNDGRIVAACISKTSAVDIVEEPEELTIYSYTIIALYDGKESAEALSNAVTLGFAVPPYTTDFTGGLSGWMPLDANNDGNTWVPYLTQDGPAVRVHWNVNEAMDDWLFSVPLKLEAKRFYNLNFRAWTGGDTFKENFEVKFGKAPTADGMTVTLVEPIQIEGGKEQLPVFQTSIVVDEDGIYFIGFHGISPADRFYLYLSDITIGAPQTTATPAAVTELAATPAADGAKEVVVSFVTPDKDISGNAISSLTKVDILRDGELVRTIENPAVGEAMNYKDNGIRTSREYEYTVIASNEAGEGLPAKTSCFCGRDLPDMPAVVSLVETENPGEVTVSWDPVTTDVRGNAIDPASVKYIVARSSNGGLIPVAYDLTDTTYTFRAVEDGEQDFVQVGVFAVTSEGQGRGRGSSLIAVGTPYAELEESFANGELHYIWGVNQRNGGIWGVYTDEQYEDIASADADGGYIACNGNFLDQSADFFSGKVDLSGFSNPKLDFKIFNITGENADDNVISVAVRTRDADWITVYTNTVVAIAGENAAAGWYDVSIPLDSYRGQAIQIQFTATTKSYAYTVLDCIAISENTSTGVGRIDKQPVAKIDVCDHAICVEGAAGQDVIITGANGIVFHSGAGDVSKPVGPGVYMVSVGGSTSKVLVK